MNRLWTLLPALAFGLLVACGGAEAQLAEDANTDPLAIPEAPGTRVEVALIGQSEARLELSIPGEIEGNQDAVLASPSGGYIESVLVEEGQEVQRGQSLVRVNAAIYAAQLEQARAQLQQAEADLTRVQALGDLASQAQRDGANTQLRVAKANADLARISLSRAVLKAPFDGVVGQLNATVGEVASPGVPLVRVIQLDPVLVSASVSDRDVVAMRSGMDAMVTTEAIPDLFSGTVTRVSPAASLQTRSFTVKIEVPNPDRRLLPGMIASVRVIESLSEGAVVIPQDWLVTRINGIGVFLDNNGVAEWRPVQPGTVVHDQIVIDAGIAVGDRVIMTGHRSLVEGDSLIVTREGICCDHGRVAFNAEQ